MFDELNIYKNYGHFFFRRDVSLKEVSKDVPNLPGVFYIIRLSKGKVELVYIGKSGPMDQNGKFKGLGLNDQLNGTIGEVPTQEFFNLKCKKENIEALDIYWFVTFDKTVQDLPTYIEGVIMQDYFDVHGYLPIWNTAY